MQQGSGITWLYDAHKKQGFSLDRIVRMGFIFLLLVNVNGTLIKSPFFFFGYPLALLFLFLLMIFAFILVGDSLSKGGKFSTLELVLIGTTGFFPIYSAIMADVYFGQPFVLGVITQKTWLEALYGVFVFYLLRSRYISVYEIRDALLTYPFITLPIYILALIFLNPDKYNGTLFVYCNSVKGGCQFKFEVMSFCFASVYYFIKFVKLNKIKYFIYFLVFFGYVFFINQKRGMSLALIGSVGLFSLFNLSLSKIIFYLVSFVLLILVAIGLLDVFAPDILGRIYLMYQDVILVILGEETGEASADARIRESATAIKYLYKNQFSVLFGNGQLNGDWGGGPQTEFQHFYPSDIGLLGVVFEYGIIGFIIGSLMYIYVYIWHSRVKMFRKNTFYQAVLYFLIFYIVHGIPSGGQFFDPGTAISSFYLGIFFFFYYIERKPERNYSL